MFEIKKFLGSLPSNIAIKPEKVALVQTLIKCEKEKDAWQENAREAISRSPRHLTLKT